MKGLTLQARTDGDRQGLLLLLEKRKGEKRPCAHTHTLEAWSKTSANEQVPTSFNFIHTLIYRQTDTQTDKYTFTHWVGGAKLQWLQPFYTHAQIHPYILGGWSKLQRASSNHCTYMHMYIHTYTHIHTLWTEQTPQAPPILYMHIYTYKCWADEANSKAWAPTTLFFFPQLIYPRKISQALQKSQCGYILFFFKCMITMSIRRKTCSPVPSHDQMFYVLWVKNKYEKQIIPKNQYAFVTKQLVTD